ncbi:GIY-YIG nuclease family protein [Gulosibacter bifidus]|uniref:GIY-YIG nuclease family protein n=1 Tax=Gulosibacter bifidus TaxID=272239 RepID=UPI0013520BCA|nr:GIY-YIG nuclease family protein [Gulosibacter bifidus]
MTGLESLTPIMRGTGGGIYVLEFADGAQYVGQTVDFVVRMRTHIRGGGRHHDPWRDVVAVSVMNVPLDELDVWERRVIAERRAAGIQLRNKVYNFGFLGPSALDCVVPVSRQQHWATGGGDFGNEQYSQAAQREPGPLPRLLAAEEALGIRDFGGGWTATGVDLVIEALALIISQVVPDAPALEGEYWTLSDFPATSGGRFATLNVGGLELAYFPRQSGFENGLDTVILNLPVGTVLKGPIPDVKRGMRTEFEQAELPSGDPCWAATTHYGLTVTDTVMVSTAGLVSADFGIKAPLRAFALDLMRAGNSSRFARWHSPELARRVYERVVDIAGEQRCV